MSNLVDLQIQGPTFLQSLQSQVAKQPFQLTTYLFFST